MKEKTVKVYGYRWVVLAVFFIANILVALHWITFAPITTDAVKFYSVDTIDIGFLSMIFMIVYIVMSIPASYIVDKYGIRIGVGFGVVLTGVFGLIKGIFGSDITMVFIAQFGIAVAQPFILNSITAVAARWFPIQERATASGIALLAQMLGIGIAMGLTPPLFIAYNMKGMLMIYGIATVIGAVIFLIFIREKPPTSPDPSGTLERHTVFKGLKHTIKIKDILILIFVFFIGLGIFNAVTTWIEQILTPRGFDITNIGKAGAIMLGGCILGAIVVPPISDKVRKRKFFIVSTIVLAVPGLIGLTFVTNLVLLLISSFMFGFFLLAAASIGLQYGTEISHPAPEATSQGLLMLAGQISGIIFIIGMDKFRGENNSMTPFMIAFIGMMVICSLLCLKLKESKMIKTG